jgi:hypothetical protein
MISGTYSIYVVVGAVEETDAVGIVGRDVDVAVELCVGVRVVALDAALNLLVFLV